MLVNKKTIFDFNFVDIDGEEVPMEKYRGQYLILVNVASECIFTRQYQQLQELWDHYNEKLTIIGFPCNDFGGQEPGEEEMIKTFCINNYNVSFKLASKINIKKVPIHPIYQWLTRKDENGVRNSKITWNFQKYFLNKNGVLVKVLSPSESVFDEHIISELESN